MAVEFQCDVIVMEKLSGNNGMIHGSKTMRLSLWRRKDIVKRVEALAHSKGIRFSTVCAINTSRLAYDGTGAVVRDNDTKASARSPLERNTTAIFLPAKSGKRYLKMSRPR